MGPRGQAEGILKRMGALLPNSSSSGGEEKVGEGGFKAAMLECTKGSKSLSLDDASGVLKE